MTTSKHGGQGRGVPTDTALIAAARRGDVDAFDSLVDRHRDAAVRLARRTLNGHVEETVDAAVAAVRTELRAGHGPSTAFRPYLLAAVGRQLASGRRRARITPVAADLTVPADCVETTAAAFRNLPEDAQVALWHTEVDGEPLLETAKLLGVEATSVAELSFSARDSLRAAQLLEHRAAITKAECRWTTNRLSGFARRTLSDVDTTKVTAHLDRCDLCAGVAPAVLALESDLQLLVATAVLGTAAPAYLDREGAGHAAGGLFAGLLRDAARPVAVALSAIAVITAGLLGTLAFADADTARQKEARPTTFTAIPVAPTNPVADAGPSSGSGSTGREQVTTTPRPAPRPLVRATERTVVPEAKTAPAQPAPADEAPEAYSLNLGLTAVNITPGAGLLGLPGLSLG